MKELAAAEYGRAAPLFTAVEHSRPLVYAVLEGTSRGRVLVDDAGGPRAAVVVLEDNVFFGGDAEKGPGGAALEALVHGEICRGISEPYVQLYSFGPRWQRKLEAVFGGQAGARRTRLNLRLDRARFRETWGNWKLMMPQGMRMEYGSEGFMRAQGMADDPFWGPRGRRFGCWLMRGSEVISECFAVYVGGGYAEVGVSTRREHRRRGYATLAAAAFSAVSVERGLEPNWGCWKERTESVRLAQKLGYVLAGSADVLVVKAKGEWPGGC